MFEGRVMTLFCGKCGAYRTIRNPSASLTNWSRQFSGIPGLGTGKDARLKVEMDSYAEKYLEDRTLKAKSHPGIFHLKKQQLPQKLFDTIQTILSRENASSLYERAKKLRTYLWSRKLPIEKEEYRQKVHQVESHLGVQEHPMLPFLSEAQRKKLELDRDNKIKHLLRRFIYHWEPINYDPDEALQYLLIRSPGEYAAFLQIFNEISKRDLNFNPRSMLDFGSGVGSAIWAAKSTWNEFPKEVMSVDISLAMNDLSELILRGGNRNNDHGFLGLFYRQYLPESKDINYDIVTSGYSLMELPSMQDRLRTLDILWRKTSRYLILVEAGTNAGFRTIIEARDYILQLDENDSMGRVARGHVFSPCPHDKICPRFSLDTIPCNYFMKYRPLYPFHQDNTDTEIFSYVVLKKGDRRKSCPGDNWPRLVQDPLIRKGHVICRFCTSGGDLKEVILTRSRHSKFFRGIGRKSCRGDLLPVEVVEEEPKQTEHLDKAEKSTDLESS